MGTTTFSGPIRSATQREGATADVGYAVMVQSALLQWKAASLTTDATFYLPANSEILDIYATTTEVFNSTGASTLSVGTSSGNTTYAGSLSVKAAGILRMTHTAAIAESMRNIGTNTKVVATVTSADQPSAGKTNVFIVYRQRP